MRVAVVDVDAVVVHVQVVIVIKPEAGRVARQSRRRELLLMFKST